MLFRPILRIPNPLTLPQWAHLLRIAAVLSLFMTLFGLASVWVNIVSSGPTLSGIIAYLTSSAVVIPRSLLLYSAADLLDNLAGRRDDLRLGRYFSVLLLVLMGLYLFSCFTHWFSQSGGLVILLSTIENLGWVLFVLAVGMIARLLTEPLVQSHEHAIPRHGRLPYALLRLARAPHPLGGMLPVVLPAGVDLLLALGAIVCVLFFTGASGQTFADIAYPLFLYVKSYVLPAFLLLGLAAWAKSRFTGIAPPRLTGILPVFRTLTLLLGLTPHVISLSSVPGFGLGGVLVCILNLLGDAWLVVFAGAVFAAGHISRMLQAVRDEETGLQEASPDAIHTGAR